MDDCRLPEYADVRKVFLQEQELSGSLPLKNLDNLKGILNSDKGQLRVSLRFFQNKFGQRIIAGKLNANIEVLCQRCLQPLEQSIVDDINLVLVGQEEDASGLEEKYDPWVCKEHKLNLCDLVEEQLILALPIVSVHSDPNCLEKLEYRLAGTREDCEQEVQNPFEELRSLIEQSAKK